MRRLLARLRRKLGAAHDAGPHPDFEPPSGPPHAASAGAPENSRDAAPAALTDPMVCSLQTTGENLHPDLELIDPTFACPVVDGPACVESHAPPASVGPADPPPGSPIDDLSDRDRSQRPPTQPEPAEVSLEAHSVFDERVEDDDADDPDEPDDEADGEAEFWERELAFEFAGGAPDDDIDDMSPSEETIDDLPDFDADALANDGESARWEDLLELELQHEAPDLRLDDLADEHNVEDWRLDGYAATLVNRMPSLRLAERSRLVGRFRAILEEFPHATSQAALAGLVTAGATLDELEDACELKRLWREAPWLWSHRRFDGMRRSWVTEERSAYRNALSWRLALRLVRRFGRSEAETKLLGDWPSDWHSMRSEHARSGSRIDPRFRSYAAFIQLHDEEMPLTDDERWFHEEPADAATWPSLRIDDEDGEVWRFEPKRDRRDTGFLSILPFAWRSVEDAETGRDESKTRKGKRNA